MSRTTRLSTALARASCAGFVLLIVAGCSGNPAIPTPQRPTFSNNTNTTAPGTAELEAGFTADPGDFYDFPLTLKYGISEDSEVFVDWSPYQWIDRSGSDGNGIGDMAIGMRQRILDFDDDQPAVAYQMRTKIPTASAREGLGTEQLDFFLAGIVDLPVEGIATTFFYQLGMLGEIGGGGIDLQHGAALAANAPVGDDVLRVFGELAAVFTHERDEDPVFMTGGVTYPLMDGLTLDGGASIGLSSDAPDFEFLIGITWNFGELGAQESRRSAPLPRSLSY